MRRLLAALRPVAHLAHLAPSVPLSHTRLARPTRSAPCASAPAQCPGADAEVDAADEEPPGACGWFDSSHALQHGLCVTEHASADAVSAELPLADWLQLHLCGWSAGPLPMPVPMSLLQPQPQPVAPARR